MGESGGVYIHACTTHYPLIGLTGRMWQREKRLHPPVLATKGQCAPLADLAFRYTKRKQIITCYPAKDTL
jgi:hypothetical protein